MSCLFAWILGLALLGCVHAEEPEKIVGGSSVWGREFPYIVSIRVGGNHYCGGALISRQHVLTAAHCVYDLAHDPTLLVTVVTGSNYIGNSGQTHFAANYFYHPGYINDGENSRWYNDIGMIKLRAPVNFNADQNMVRLPTSRPPVNVLATVAGWGLTSTKQKAATEVLQKADLQIISTNNCQQYFEIEILNIMICTLKGVNHGTCSGDSGGPLIYNNRIIGVVSGGIPCALGYPDVFTNIYMYLNYIQAWLRM